MAHLTQTPADLVSIRSAVARSSIVTSGLLPRATEHCLEILALPMGYEAADVLILDWIAAEALRGRRTYLPH